MPHKQLSEIHGRKLTIPAGIAHEILTISPLKHGSKIAIVCMHQPADLYASVSKSKPTAEYLRWSFEEIARASHVMAAALAGAGVRPGMKIAAFVENSIESHILFRAALELNCLIAHINPKSATNRREVRHFFEMVQPSVVMVPNSSVAKKVEEAVPEDVEGSLVNLVADYYDAGLRKWQKFGNFLEAGLNVEEALSSLTIERRLDDQILILFTSGTTNLPKGAVHTNRSLMTIFLGIAENLKPKADTIPCVHVGLFHIFGMQWSCSHLLSGCTIVHPSPAYDAKSSLRAIDLEGANGIPGVPALISALIQHPDFSEKHFDTIRYAIMGATTILPEHIKMATAKLGAAKAVDSYGMTEAGIQWLHTPGTEPEDTYPLPETMMKVCDPETGRILPRGERGELHTGGVPVVPKYLLSREQSEEANDVFYDDEHGHWIRTGDLAEMADNGVVTLVGRLKDVIIRGGENISPSSIEQVLAADFGLVAEVIGIPDEVAGEIPVAVVKGNPATEISEIRGKLIETLGPSFAVEDTIHLKDIGMNDFPTTASGKTQKNVLRDRVVKHFEKQNGSSDGHGEIDPKTLTSLWSKHLGLSSQDELTPQRSVLDFADSLVLARFSTILRRNTGHTLSLQELMDNPTIEAQALLLSKRSKTSQSSVQPQIQLPKHDGPPTRDEMPHAMGDEATLKKTKTLSEEVLNPLGLSWEDVEDVIPLYPTADRFLKKRRPQSTNHRHTWLCRGKSVEEMKVALKRALSHHSILIAMVIQHDNTPLHLTIRPSDKFFSHIFTRLPPVKDTQELWKQCYNDPKLDWAAAPGPMLRVSLSHVEEENCAGLVYRAQHSTFDGVSLEMFLQDLDTTLTTNDALPPRVPYKAWADNFYNLRHSESAQKSIAWHCDRLRGLSSHKKSLFPEQRAVEWFKGNSEGWIDLSTGKPGPSRKALDNGASDGVVGSVQRVKLQDAKSLRAEHGVEVPQIVKTALAIVNARHTKTNVALFGQYQAGRTWAFLPDWQARLMPEALDVNGPTVQNVAVKVQVDPEETLVQLFSRLQQEQADLNRHSHAPYDQLLSKLNGSAKDDKDGDIMEDIIRRQIFNWLPGGLATEYQSLQLVQMLSRTDVGLLWNCKMIDDNTLQVHASWDDAQLTGKEAEALLTQLTELTERLAVKENWEKKLGELK